MGKGKGLIGSLLGVTLAVSSAIPAGAAPPEQASIGQRYADGLDTRLSATAFADTARRAGYTSYGYPTGRSADDAWLDGLSSAILGLFGHANAGIFQTGEGPSDPEDQILGVGSEADVVSPYAGLRLFSEYLPYVDVDDMRLLVVAGCYTSRRDDWLGSFTDLPVRRGVDAVVTFPDLVYFPASTPTTPVADTNYSGNYFWNRFSYHFGTGASLGVALARARTDLVAKEGSAGGWDRYLIHGSVANPAGVLLNPAAPGESWTSDPVPTLDFLGFSSLTTLRVTETTGPFGELVHEVQTAEGVSYRVTADGSVLDAVGVATNRGTVTITEVDAAARADRFIAAVLGKPAAQLTRVAVAATGHGEGQQLVRVTYRTGATDLPGARQVVVEVDRRSGAVVYYADVRASAVSSAFSVTEADAIAAARRHTGFATAAATAVADTWDTSRWIVTLDAGLAGRPGFETPNVARVVIDATTGVVVRSEKA